MGVFVSKGRGGEEVRIPRQLEAHRHSITFMEFVGVDGEMLVTASEDRTVRLWDFGREQRYAKRWRHGGLRVRVVGSKHDEVGRRIEAASGGATRSGGGEEEEEGAAVSICCPIRGREKEGHEHWVTCAALDAKFGVVYSGSLDRSVKAWDAYNGECLRTYVGHTDWVNGVHLFDDTLFSVSDDGHVRLWRIATLMDHNDTDDQIDVWEEHTSAIRGVVPCGQRLVTADASGTVKCWQMNDVIQMGSLSSVQSGVGVVTCVSAPYWENEAEGKMVVQGGGGDRGSGGLAHKGGEDKDRRAKAAREKWKGGGLSVFVGGSRGVVRWMDMRGRAQLASYEGHGACVTGIEALDASLFTASDDKTLRAWSVTEGTCLQVYSGHLQSVRCFAVSRQGWMTSGAEDVRVWDMATGEVREVVAVGQRVDCMAVGGGRDDEVVCGMSGRVRSIGASRYKKGSADKQLNRVVLPLVYVERSSQGA